MFVRICVLTFVERGRKRERERERGKEKRGFEGKEANG